MMFHYSEKPVEQKPDARDTTKQSSSTPNTTNGLNKYQQTTTKNNPRTPAQNRIWSYIFNPYTASFAGISIIAILCWLKYHKG
jgi:hypothetical protein